MTPGKIVALTRRTFVGKVMSLLFIYFFFFFFFLEANYSIIVVFAIHRHGSAVGLHAFPILIPAPISHKCPGLVHWEGPDCLTFGTLKDACPLSREDYCEWVTIFSRGPSQPLETKATSLVS